MRTPRSRLAVLFITILLVGFAQSLIAAPQHVQGHSSQEAEGAAGSLYLPIVNKGIEPVIPDTTVVLDDETLEDLTAISPDGTVFTFVANSPALDALDPNDVMVGGVSTTAPYGFLRKVTSVVVQPNGEVTVTTADATLEEAIEDGSFSVYQTLSPDAMEQLELSACRPVSQRMQGPEAEFYIEIDDVVLYDADGNPTTTSDQIRANGELTIDPSIDFHVTVRDHQLETFRFTTSNETTSELELQAAVDVLSLEGNHAFGSYCLPPIVGSVGPVPVVMIPVLTPSVGASGVIKTGLLARVSQETTMRAGVSYVNGSWQPIGQHSTNYDWQPPTLFTSLNAKGYVNMEISLLLYGVAGPTADIQPFLELEASTSQTPWWELYGGLDVIVGVEMETLSQQVASQEFPAIGVRQLLASASTPPPPSPTPSPTPPPSSASTRRVSVASGGFQSNGGSETAAISGDGRYIAFQSSASDLVPNDTNGSYDIFVHDQQTGQTTRVSVASDGTQGNSLSWFPPSISHDGRYVAFQSHADNLIFGDTNGQDDIFVHDRQTGQTTRVSVASDGTQGNAWSTNPSISGDGRYVAFESGASNLVPNDTNGFLDVFVHDRLTEQTTRVSVASNGTQGNATSFEPSISYNGRYIAFTSDASNIVPGSTLWSLEVYLHDRQTGQTTRVAIGINGGQANSLSRSGSISADGRYVAFVSNATDLVPNDTNDALDIFVRDMYTVQTTRVSVASGGTQSNSWSETPSISGDGGYVTFQSGSTNLVPNDNNGHHDVFVHDRLAGQTMLVSVSSNGTQGNDYSMEPVISETGRYIAFGSRASNLVVGDTNSAEDIFVRDRGN